MLDMYSDRSVYSHCVYSLSGTGTQLSTMGGRYMDRVSMEVEGNMEGRSEEREGVVYGW